MRFLLLLSGVVLGMGLLTACGGSSTSTPPPVLTYTGPTTPAVIASLSDGQTLTAAALAGGTTGIIDDVAGRRDLPTPAPFLPGLLKVLSSVHSIALLDASPTPENISPSGDCGGNCAYNVISVSGGIENGTVTYTNYCLSPDGFTIVINGTCNWSQNGWNGSEWDGTNATEWVSASDVQVTVAGKTYTCNLSFTATIANAIIGTISLECKYKAPDGKIYWAHNYQVLPVSSKSTLAISGEFYHPDYGYVAVTTPTALAFSDCSGAYLPTGGSLQVTGANGVTATFTPQNCSTYQVCINNGTQTCQTFNWP